MSLPERYRKVTKTILNETSAIDLNKKMNDLIGKMSESGYILEDIKMTSVEIYSQARHNVIMIFIPANAE